MTSKEFDKLKIWFKDNNDTKNLNKIKKKAHRNLRN